MMDTVAIMMAIPSVCVADCSSEGTDGVGRGDAVDTREAASCCLSVVQYNVSDCGMNE